MSALHKAGSCLALAALALALSAPAASAQTMELLYTGTFGSPDALNLAGTPTAGFTGTTPFLVTALFDAGSPNLAALVNNPGFVAYSPISATLTIGTSTYQFVPTSLDPVHGVSVAIFDSTSGFGPPNHVAAGLLQNPLADGAGFIGDWVSTSTTFSASQLTPTVFTGYTGVGYQAGPNPNNVTSPPAVPIPLTDASGKSYLLTLGTYDEEALNNVQNTAQLIAAPVPETSSAVSRGLLLALGMGGLVVATKRRKAVPSF